MSYEPQPGERVVYNDRARDVVAVVEEGRPYPNVPGVVHITWPGHAANVWASSLRPASSGTAGPLPKGPR
jgi:hypothetical protein